MTAGAPSPEHKYWAFISYSHKDRPIGDWLHKSLESFQVPKALRGQPTRMGPLPARLYPIFRDREELAAAPDLGDRIREALRQSRYLIVVCSPDAARSPWVNQEIAYFKSIGREDAIFAVIARGEPSESFPPALRYRVSSDGRVTDEPAEPLGADLRDDKDGRRNALLKLIAGMLQTGFDSLRQRDLERRNARLRRLVALSAALVLAFAAIALFAFLQWQSAEERGRIALSRQLAIQSRSLLGTSPDLPLLLSLEAIYAKETVDARRSLFEALTAYRRPVSLFRSPSRQAASAMAIANDGKTLVTAGNDGRLVFFDLTSDPPTARAQDAHTGAIRAIALNSGGTLLVTAGDDGEVRLWDFPGGKRREDRSVPNQGTPVTAVAFGPRDVLAFGTHPQDGLWAILTAWDLAASQAVRTMKAASDGDVSDLRFSPDGNILASAAVGGDTILWNLSTGEQLHSDFLKDTGSLAFSPDGHSLASGSWELRLRRISDFDSKTFALPDAPTHISDVEFSPGGKVLASAAHSGFVIVWDPVTGKPVEDPFQLNIGPVDHIAFGPDGSWIVAAGADGAMAKVSLGSSPLRRDLVTEFRDFAFHPKDSGSLISADDRNIAFWDADSLAPRDRLPTPFSGKALTVFAISPGGDTLAAGSLDGQVTLIGTSAGNAIATRAHG